MYLRRTETVKRNRFRNRNLNLKTRLEPEPYRAEPLKSRFRYELEQTNPKETGSCGTEILKYSKPELYTLKRNNLHKINKVPAPRDEFAYARRHAMVTVWYTRV